MPSTPTTRLLTDRDQFLAMLRAIVAKGCCMGITTPPDPFTSQDVLGLVVPYDHKGEHGSAMCALVWSDVFPQDMHDVRYCWPVSFQVYVGADGKVLANQFKFTDDRGRVYTLGELEPSLPGDTRYIDDDRMDGHLAWQKHLAANPGLAQRLADDAASLAGVAGVLEGSKRL